MKEFLYTIISIIITGIGVLLCLSCCYLATKSDEYWQEIRKKLESKNDRN